MPLFTSPDDVRERLAATGYLADDAIATTVFLADALGKPLLVEGPAGTGKTELAKAVAESASAGLGLWMSHQVCNFVAMHRGPDGFTIRLVAGEVIC